VHHVDTQLGMSDQNFFEQEGAAQPDAIVRAAVVGNPRIAFSKMKGNRDVEFFGKLPVGLHTLVVGCNAGVLILDFAQHVEIAGFHMAA
jgi:hypothetical protein